MKIKSLRDVFRRLPASGFVRHELRNFNLGMTGAGLPPSVLQLARRLGFDVVLVKLPKRQRGRLLRDTFSDSGYRIEINADDDVQTRRWTVLHEIFHAYLHPKDDLFAEAQYRAGGLHFYDHDEQREEAEANTAVEALIFGDGALKAAWTLYGGDQDRIARHFGVSLATLKIALSKM